MLRGINRSIIEINETEHRYFEKILIFVKPEFGALPINQLEKEATRFVSNISFLPVGLKKSTMTARKRAKQIRKKRLTFYLGGICLAVALFIAATKFF